MNKSLVHDELLDLFQAVVDAIAMSSTDLPAGRNALLRKLQARLDAHKALRLVRDDAADPYNL